MTQWKTWLLKKLENPKIAPFVPKSITTLLQGYSREDLGTDVVAGITVGVISLPLAMAFAIGSGVDPARGIYTSIVAGFLISLLGGSRFQIAGPTGAFVVLLFTIVQKNGYEGLAVATFVASFILILLGFLRCGVLIRFIPHPVIIGFTAGIATVLLISQFKDFCGLVIENPSSDAIDRLHQYSATISTFDWLAFIIASITVAIMIRVRRYSRRLPAPVIALAIITTLAWIFSLPIHTVFSKYGEIPASLPIPSLPNLSFDLIRKTFPDAIAIALLAGIESLLSCVIADSMTGTKHLSNCELIAQGVGNLGSTLFGGIPATGAIARTAANVQMQAKSPISGMIHAITVLALIMVLAPFASIMPLPALAAVLSFVAWNMMEFTHIKNIFKGPKSDRLVLVITYLVTICVNIITAVEVGVLLSILVFMKKMSDTTTGNVWKLLEEEEEPVQVPEKLLSNVPQGVQVFEIEGPFFFAVSDLLNELYERLNEKPKTIIVRLRSVPLIDSSGLHAIERFENRLKGLGIGFYLCEAKPSLTRLLNTPQPEKSFEETLQLIEQRSP